MHQIRFRLGLRNRPRWGSLQRSPRPPSWIWGPLSGRGGLGWGREGKGEGRGSGGEGKEGGPPSYCWTRAPQSLATPLERSTSCTVGRRRQRVWRWRRCSRNTSRTASDWASWPVNWRSCGASSTTTPSSWSTSSTTTRCTVLCCRSLWSAHRRFTEGRGSCPQWMHDSPQLTIL